MPSFIGGLNSGISQGFANLLQLLAYQQQVKQHQADQQQKLLILKANLAAKGLDLQPGPGGQWQIVPSQKMQQVQQQIAPQLEAVRGLQTVRNQLLNQAVVPTQGASAADLKRSKQESIDALTRQIQQPLAKARQAATGTGIRSTLRPVESAAQGEQDLREVYQQQFQRRRQEEQDHKEFGKRKLELLQSLRGTKGMSPEVGRQIHQAESVDDLIDIVGDLGALNELSIKDVSPARIAYMAAQDDPIALKALRLMSERQRNATTAQLARDSAAGDETAIKALELLRQLKETGVKSSRRQQRDEEEAASKHFWRNEPSALEEKQGTGVSGTARPKVKSFKRIN